VAAQNEDANEIAELYLSSRRHALPYLHVAHSDDETRWWIREIVLPAGDVWVVRADQKILGFMALSSDYVDQLYVLPEHVGQGIGSGLLAVAKARQPLGLRLHTFLRNESGRRFYEAHGFRLVSTRDGSHNEEGEPDALYSWHPL
jgi:GNAT superfamily N-acetyltransferase